jgi:hypothetical protein
MNLRHAAALALVGWYLMVPPVGKNDDGDIVIGIVRPFHDWFISRNYDSAEECRRDAILQTRSGPKPELTGKVFFYPTNDLAPGDDVAVVELLNKHAQCIATDDPRLKEK